MAAPRIRFPAFSLLALLMFLTLCGAGGPAVPAIQQPGMRADGTIIVTSESEEYCQRLSRSVRERMRTPHAIPFGAMQDARHLYETGTELCTGPYVRAGIERLRRALFLLNHSQDHS